MTETSINDATMFTERKGHMSEQTLPRQDSADCPDVVPPQRMVEDIDPLFPFSGCKSED